AGAVVAAATGALVAAAAGALVGAAAAAALVGAAAALVGAAAGALGAAAGALLGAAAGAPPPPHAWSKVMAAGATTLAASSRPRKARRLSTRPLSPWTGSLADTQTSTRSRGPAPRSFPTEARRASQAREPGPRRPNV